MTVHIKSVMYALLPPIYNSVVFNPLCLRQACQGTFDAPALVHDTAYQVLDVCIVASRLQICCVPQLNSAGNLSALIVILRIMILVRTAVKYF